MRRTPATRLGTALAGAALLLAGCADDGEPRSDPTWSPTAVPESPSTSPADAATKPALPDAATKATKAGAEAFIQYYWDLINYAEVTGDVKPLRRTSGSSCDGCNDGIRAIRKHYRNGGHIMGGEYRVTIKSTEHAKVEDNAAVVIGAQITVSSAEQSVINGDGTTRMVKPGSSEWTLAVLWNGDHWRVDIMRLTR